MRTVNASACSGNQSATVMLYNDHRAYTNTGVLLTHGYSRVTAPVISFRLLIADARVRSQGSPRKMCGRVSRFRIRLSKGLLFSVSPHYTAHIHSSPSEWWRINTLEGAVPKKVYLHPKNKLRGKINLQSHSSHIRPVVYRVHQTGLIDSVHWNVNTNSLEAKNRLDITQRNSDEMFRSAGFNWSLTSTQCWG
jgi:hypothetical protein